MKLSVIPKKCLNKAWPFFILICLLLFTNPINAADTVTRGSLVWQQSDDGKLRTWDDANNYCKSLVLGGSSDWRLPTKNEIKSLVVCTNGKSTPLQDGDTCGSSYSKPTIDSSFTCSSTGVSYGGYLPNWSSTLTSEGSCSSNNCAKFQYWDTGLTSYTQVDSQLGVRCVRKESFIYVPLNPYQRLIGMIEEGDILLFSSCDGSVSNVLACSPFPGIFSVIPLGYGYYRHAALVYKKSGDKVTIIHARGPSSGVGTDVITKDYLDNYKMVSLLRVKNLSETVRKQVASYAFYRWNKGAYDSLFVAYNNSVYCSELVWDAYKNSANIALDDKSPFPQIPTSIFYPDMLSQSKYLYYVTSYKTN